MADDGELPEVQWFAGVRGASQSCDQVCAAVEDCGGAEDADPVACAEPPSCVAGWLETAWLESNCALLQSARQQAGLSPWTNCEVCSPADYCQTSSCMFCAPGVLQGSAVEFQAYYGSSVVSPDVCTNLYLDVRNQPLCPCYLPMLVSALGWTITAGIVGALGLYFLGGWAYGRFGGSKPPEEGDGFFAHPDGLGAAAWHPHYEVLCEGCTLVGEGGRYFLVWVDAKRNGVPFVYERLGDGGGEASQDSEKGSLVAPAGKRGGKDQKQNRENKRGKGETKKKSERRQKPKPKPKPSSKHSARGKSSTSSKAAATEAEAEEEEEEVQQQQQQAAALGLTEVAEVEDGVHPSMAKIKVVLRGGPASAEEHTAGSANDEVHTAPAKPKRSNGKSKRSSRTISGGGGGTGTE